MRKPRIIFFDIDGTEPDLDDYFAVAKSTVPPASFKMLAMSSVSKIENCAFSPIASPSSRSMRMPKA